MSPYHTVYDLIYLASAILISCGLGYLFLRVCKTPKQKMIPFIVITVLILGTEVIKQIMSFGYRGDFYRLKSLPFFICSSPFIWYVMACFCKGRAREIGWALSHCLSVTIIVGLVLAPEIILYTYTKQLFQPVARTDFFVYHSLFFHFMLILFGILSLFLRVYKPQTRDVKWVFILFILFMILPALFTILLNEDFAGFESFPIDFSPEWLRVTVLAMGYTAIICGFAVLTFIILPIKYAKNKK